MCFRLPKTGSNQLEPVLQALWLDDQLILFLSNLLILFTFYEYVYYIKPIYLKK